jgi:hypothetical protein
MRMAIGLWRQAASILLGGIVRSAVQLHEIYPLYRRVSQ